MLEIKNWYDCSKCGKALDDGEFEKIAGKIVCFECIEKENRKQKQYERKVAKNDLCPCGSGQKYKNCCGESGPKKGLLSNKVNRLYPESKKKRSLSDKINSPQQGFQERKKELEKIKKRYKKLSHEYKEILAEYKIYNSKLEDYIKLKELVNKEVTESKSNIFKNILTSNYKCYVCQKKFTKDRVYKLVNEETICLNCLNKSLEIIIDKMKSNLNKIEMINIEDVLNKEDYLNKLNRFLLIEESNKLLIDYKEILNGAEEIIYKLKNLLTSIKDTDKEFKQFFEPEDFKFIIKLI